MVAETSETNRQYEVEDAARTLIRAQQIKTDKKLYAETLKELQKQKTALNKALGGQK